MFSNFFKKIKLVRTLAISGTILEIKLLPRKGILVKPF